MKIVDDQDSTEKKYGVFTSDHLHDIRDSGEFLKLLVGTTEEIAYEAPIAFIDIVRTNAERKLIQIHDALEYLAAEVEDFKYKPLILNRKNGKDIGYTGL